MSGNKTPHTQFPTHGLLPRADTQAGDFVRKHPHYDGRGTIVAVLDTGIAPMAMGLHTTTDGKRKVLDYVDCTGSGDVRLQAPRTNTDELVGATGRKLKVNSKWKNPTGEWRVGAKRLYEITPDILKEDIKKERQAVFRKGTQILADSIATRISDIKTTTKDEDAELRHELEAQRDVLKDFGAKYEDPGPVLDILVFHDGKQWRAAIDTQETGDFTGVEALGAYKLTGDIGKLAKRNLFYYTLNFYEEGKVLSIVANVGSHSTHVAGIIGAHHPDEPQNDGVAPGAQLLSLMIGDHRVSSLETGTGLTRAANAIIEHGADLANMSYGEPSATANSGQWVQLLRKEVIKKHRCIFVSSAGNEGPALSTAGAPGGASDDIIGVGAYVGYEQIKAEYTMYDTVKDTVFTWSSRGPTADGSRGVDIYAPGSAITSYPTYTLQRLHLANGTSMSSPNLCGCLALLVSAWKHEFGKEGEPKVSPYRIKNAMMATAKQFGDELQAGLVQVDAAWAFLKKYRERSFEDVEYEVNISSQGNARGIYMRDHHESASPRIFSINVSPVFPKDLRAVLDNDASGQWGELESQLKFEYEQRVILSTSESWIKVPEAVYVSSEGRSFDARVDPTSLERGRLHVAEILGFDSRNVDRGAIFRIPVTITKPSEVGASGCVRFPALRFQPTEVVRRFIDVPRGATQAKFVIRAPNALANGAAPATFYLHAVQLAPQTRFTQYELNTHVTIGHSTYAENGGLAEQSYTKTMKVLGGCTLEVCMAPFWSQLDTHEVDVTVTFSGITVHGSGTPALTGLKNDSALPGIVLNGNQPVSRVDLVAAVRPEYGIKVTATLDTLRRALRPAVSSITPLTLERDTHPEAGTAIQQLILDYKYSTSANGVSITPRLTGIDSLIYEAWTDNVALLVFDAKKQRVGAHFGYPRPITLRRKGDYLIRVQIRHRSAKDLEALKQVPLIIETSLTPKVPIPVEFALASVFTKTVGNVRNSSKSIQLNSIMPVFLKTFAVSPPKDTVPGDILRGSLSASPNTADLLLEYVVPSKANEEKQPDESSTKSSSKKQGDSKKKEAEESQADKDRKAMQEAMRNLKIEWVKKAQDPDVRTELIRQLEAEQANDTQVLAAQLESLDCARRTLPTNEATSKITQETALQIVELADRIVAHTNTSELASTLYGKPAEDNSDKEERAKAEKAKKLLVSALTAKCRALAVLAVPTANVSSGGSDGGEFVDLAAEEEDERKLASYEAAVKELTRWAGDDSQNIEYLMAAVVPLYSTKQQYARALKPVVEWLNTTALTDAAVSEWKTMIDVRNKLVAKLQWSMWARHFDDHGVMAMPAEYAEF